MSMPIDFRFRNSLFGQAILQRRVAVDNFEEGYRASNLGMLPDLVYDFVDADINDVMDFSAAIEADQTLSWTDEDGVKHAITTKGAIKVLSRLFREWPGGLDEVDSCIRTLSKKE